MIKKSTVFEEGDIICHENNYPFRDKWFGWFVATDSDVENYSGENGIYYIWNKLSLDDIQKISKAAIKMLKKGKGLREGQATFNAAWDLFPHHADKLRGTKEDCFHIDEKIPAFLKALGEEEVTMFINKNI